MKKFYIILVALFMINGARSQWVPQNSGTTNNLNSVYFTDVNTGYAVGDSGTILKTSNGGYTWVLQNSGSSTNFSAVDFPTSDIGYVVGEIGSIFKTIDGGINWFQPTTGFPPFLKLHSVDFTDIYTGFCIGDGIYRSSNGGYNWDTTLISNVSFRSVDFPSEDTGYVIGDIEGQPPWGQFIKTTDGGNNWTIINNFCATGVSYVEFTDVNIGYVVGFNLTLGGGIFYKTLNGGETWNYIQLTDRILKAVSFPCVSDGYGVGYNWMGGSGIILKTIDGGETWIIQDSIISCALNSVCFLNSDTGYAVGNCGTILKTTNGGLPVGINDKPLIKESLLIYPNPSSITISTPTTPDKNTFMTIYNINGQAILSRQITEPTITIDIRDLPSGIYVVKVVGDNEVQVGKFVKN